MKLRQEVNTTDTWDVTAMYPSIDAWEIAFSSLIPKDDSWPQLDTYKGRLQEGPQILKEALEQILSIEQQLAHLFVYAQLRHHEDISHDLHKQLYARATAAFHKFKEHTAWFEPELLALPQPTIDTYLSAPILAPYHFYIEKIVRMKAHMLNEKEEALIAMASAAFEAPQKSFRAINDADFVFGKTTDSAGKEYDLTHASYPLYMRSPDRQLRQNTFTIYFDKYNAHKNTLCEMLNGIVQVHRFSARARKFDSCLHAALYPFNIDLSVYHSLISTVRKNLDALHDYSKLRKERLKLPELHLYDFNVPLVSQVEIDVPYEQAVEKIIASTAPLGDEYQSLLKKGLQQQRWVDKYENRNKCSGAHSTGTYKTFPYILMNYKGILRDMMTLAHEAGHSMHSLMSWNHQPYQYSDYSIFVAEVASTFNEELLMQHLLKESKDPKEKAYLINQKIEDIRATLFRQTMFAEFELLIHQLVEQGIPLTPDHLMNEYLKLCSDYFGPDVIIDPAIAIEWARIPHFYANFYVYQYATGISSALALAKLVTQDRTLGAQKAYLKFLQSGSSQYPIELLASAGVDLRSPAPVQAALDQFRMLTKDLRNLTV